MDDDLIRLTSELISGCQVPLSLGMLGAAAQPYRELADKLHLFGWNDAESIEEALRQYLAKVGETQVS